MSGLPKQDRFNLKSGCAHQVDHHHCHGRHGPIGALVGYLQVSRADTPEQPHTMVQAG
ncbi:hypothetical protein ACIA6C_14360 [Streptomyces sp. NPDC051578]|uniref:hypothetical protein n=1 Tax=Streptomyces sp. NPDC051578 TaxID=3365662 RepID=UPI003797D7F8